MLKQNRKLQSLEKTLYSQLYGVLKINKKGKLLKILEKPKTETLISTGIFVINHELQKFVKRNTKLKWIFF